MFEDDTPPRVKYNKKRMPVDLAESATAEIVSAETLQKQNFIESNERKLSVV